mmetsp:Transcript_18968/g.39872  ORF Transcript_18968/g.39872 Transcript_18968/m.39872 type:complete len:80 (+) Transcript_18968:576-815(+)
MFSSFMLANAINEDVDWRISLGGPKGCGANASTPTCDRDTIIKLVTKNSERTVFMKVRTLILCGRGGGELSVIVEKNAF